jgi:hypothetical protein
MKHVLLIIAVFLILSGRTSLAADENAHEQMVQDYRSALLNNDQPAIDASWKMINADPQAQAYIEEKYPLVASSLRWTGISLKASRDLEEYRNNYPSENLTLENSGTPMPVIPLLDNRGTVLRYPNENQPSNELIVYRDLNAPFRDNTSRALEYPIQNEPANQDMIRNRVQRLNQTGQ